MAQENYPPRDRVLLSKTTPFRGCQGIIRVKILPWAKSGTRDCFLVPNDLLASLLFRIFSANWGDDIDVAPGDSLTAWAQHVLLPMPV